MSSNFNNLVYLLVGLLFICVFCVNSQDAPCCSKTSGSCRSACEQMSLVNIAIDSNLRQQRFQDVLHFCPSQLVHFWECMNETIRKIERGESWSGRSCCTLPQSARCQRACVTASSKHDLYLNCRQSDELSFYSCLERQEMGDECCCDAKPSECYKACKDIFRSHLTPSRELRNAVNDACSENSPKVLQCVKYLTKVTPATNVHKYLHCCEKTVKQQCKDSCRNILRTKTTEQEIVDNLQEGGCGPPLPHDKLWQCFLQNGDTSDSSSSSSEISRIDRMGMDSAKLHCCNKATSTTCRRLCLKTFSDEWTKSWKHLNQECLQTYSENNLLDCLDDVEEPCELGCDGLSYCTNFNNRPTQLFRSCNSQADEAARYDVALWQEQGYISLPAGVQLYVRNITNCSPNMWKAVACALQIKPCQRESHANRICREDCYAMLSQCLDWTRMPVGQSVSSICIKLSPDNPQTPCVSLKPYLEPGDDYYYNGIDRVTAPCKGDPCNPGLMCIVNRNCVPGKPCKPYRCVPGCKMGEVSQYMVPKGSYVRIPLPTEHKGCLKICQCSGDGIIERCQPMPCVPTDVCRLSTKTFDHGSWFLMDCNVCSCYAGEITCSKKQCQVSGVSVRSPSFTSLPCNCPPHYVPVCGRNGNTYPSSCLAKCAGLQDVDFEFGSCSSKDPCESNPCVEGFRCVPVRKVCLSMLERPCKQYQCVGLTSPCSESTDTDPVCDTDGIQHSNICYLVRNKKTLAYRGRCLVNCDNAGQVCGMDGETYISECAAKASHIMVDYIGPCVAVGLVAEDARAQCGPAVACPPLPHGGCLAVTPPGACCPICGGALRMLYSTKQVDRALYALKGVATNALTVEAILQSLERHVQVAECSVKGFLTVELDIFVAVVADRPNASELQREACVREAEKLANLVRRSSPRILSELALSSLTTATSVHVMSRSSSSTIHSSSLIPWLLCCLFVGLGR